MLGKDALGMFLVGADTFREGKYISAPYIANKFVKRLWQQKIIKKKSP